MPFLPETDKLLTNLHDIIKYAINTRNLKQALNHRLILEKVLRVLKFKQKYWLKPYIDVNGELREEAKDDFEKYFLKSLNNIVFEKNYRERKKI